MCKHKQATRLAGRRPASASGRVYQSSEGTQQSVGSRTAANLGACTLVCQRAHQGGRRPSQAGARTLTNVRELLTIGCARGVPEPCSGPHTCGRPGAAGSRRRRPRPTVGCKHQGAAKAQPQVARSFHSLAIPHAQPPTHTVGRPKLRQGAQIVYPHHIVGPPDPFGGSSTCFITVLAQRPAPKM